MTSSSSRYDPRLSKPGRVTGQTVHDRDATVVRMYGRFMPTAKRPSAPQRGGQCSAPSAKEPRHKVMRCQTESSSCTARHEEKLHRHGLWRGVLGKNIRSFLKSLGKYYVCPVPAYECPKPNAKPLLPPPSTKRSKSTCGGAGTMKINLSHGGDRPPDYCTLILEPRDIGVRDKKAVGEELGMGLASSEVDARVGGISRHDISLGESPETIRVSVVSSSDCNERATQQHDTPPNTRNSPTERVDSEDTRPPTPVPQLSISEGEFNHFYHRLDPFESRSEFSFHVVTTPMPGREFFPIRKGPFTTPPGGTDLACVDGKSASGFLERDPIVTRVAGPGLVVHNTFSPSLLAGIATWELDALLKHAGVGPVLRHELRATETRFKILEFEHAFRYSDASVLSDAYPLARLFPHCPPKIVDITDEDELFPARSIGTTVSGAGGGGSTGTRGACGSMARSRGSQSGSLPTQRGLKRGSDGPDRGNNKRGRREPPPGVPGAPGSSERPGVRCPFGVRLVDRQRRSCASTFKNLSKLKEHLRRVHFPHLRCPIEDCIFIEGDKFQIQRHIRAAHPGHEPLAPRMQNINPSDWKKHKALEARTLTWDQINEICFSDANSDAASGDGGAIPNSEPPDTPDAQATPQTFSSSGFFNDSHPGNPDSERAYGGNQRIDMDGYSPGLGSHLNVDRSRAGERLPSPSNDPQEDVEAPAPLVAPSQGGTLMEHINRRFEEFRRVTTQRLLERLENRQEEAITRPGSGKLSPFEDVNRFFMELGSASRHVLKSTSTYSSESHSRDTWVNVSSGSALFPQDFSWDHSVGMPTLTTDSQSGISINTPDAPLRNSFRGEHLVSAMPQQPQGDSIPLPPPPPPLLAGSGAVHGLNGDGDLLAFQTSAGHYTVANNYPDYGDIYYQGYENDDDW